MAKCINCGTKLNFINETYALWDETSEKLCNKCRSKFKGNLDISNVNNRQDFLDKYESYLRGCGFTDSGVSYIADYYDYIINKDQREEEKKEEERKQNEEKIKYEEERIEYEAERAAALPSILISSGFSFEGYKIIKYSGYISGDDAVQIPRSGAFGSDNGKKLTDALVRIRRQALKELKEAAYDLGCNAVIGVDFDYITLEPETANLTGATLYEPYIICVTANGNAVIIEKE